MTDAKVCPMQFSGSFDDAGTLSSRTCLEDRCAWWLPVRGRGRDKIPHPAGCAVAYDAKLTRAGFHR